MKEVNTDRRVLIVIVFTLVLIIISLILGIVNSIFKFESIFDYNLIGTFSTFMGALLGAGITGGIANKVAKIQIEKQQELFRKEKEIENHYMAEKEEKKSIQNHFNQILILEKIEIVLIRIMQETAKVNEQAKINVMPNNYFQTVSYIKKAKDNYWKASKSERKSTNYPIFMD